MVNCSCITDSALILGAIFTLIVNKFVDNLFTEQELISLENIVVYFLCLHFLLTLNCHI